jgi:L-ascorbate metabolism protein UlaG (beta-lactamase superfamily)
MDITYLGHSSFKIKTKNATLVTDPYAATVGFKFPKTEADIVTVSHDHDDHNQSSLVEGVKKVIDGPGEYEVMGVSILGFSSYHDNEKGEGRGKNTIYVIEADGIRIAHLGDLGHSLSTELVDDIAAIDILMLPVGGDYTIGAKEASEVVSKIDPYFVIPMHYQAAGLNPATFSKLEGVEAFIKETALPSETLPKFSIKKDEIMEDQNTKVIVLERK